MWCNSIINTSSNIKKAPASTTGGLVGGETLRQEANRRRHAHLHMGDDVGLLGGLWLAGRTRTRGGRRRSEGSETWRAEKHLKVSTRGREAVAERCTPRRDPQLGVCTPGAPPPAPLLPYIPAHLPLWWPTAARPGRTCSSRSGTVLVGILLTVLLCLYQSKWSKSPPAAADDLAARDGRGHFRPQGYSAQYSPLFLPLSSCCCLVISPPAVYKSTHDALLPNSHGGAPIHSQ